MIYFTGAEGVGRNTQAGLIDGMSGAKRGRSDTPLIDRRNPVLAVSRYFFNNNTKL